MAKARAQELRGMDVDELENRLAEAKQELFNLRFQLATDQLDNNSRINHLRKQVARIHTVIRQQELEAFEAAEAAEAADAAEAEIGADRG